MQKKKRIIWLILMVVCISVAAVCVTVFVVRSINKHNAEKILENQQEIVNSAESTDVSEVVEEAVVEEEPVPDASEDDSLSLKDMLALDEPDPLEGIEIPEKAIDWDELHELNPDIYAWITVSDTLVDYPVLQHPTDDYYYLNHNIDGTKGYPGCIYTEGTYNSKDFSDRNTVLYGHNMNDKTIFGTLHRFDDPEFIQSDKYIFIYMEDEILVYKIFGAYEYSSKHIMWSYDFSNEYVFEDYLEEIFSIESKNGRIANFRDDIEVDKDDKIITLSTCTTDSSEDYRYLVQGVLIGTK